MMKKLLVSVALLSISIFSALAVGKTNDAVTYDVKRGFAETFFVSQTEQLGKFRVVLKPIRGSDFDRDQLILKGISKGFLNADFTINHTFVNKERTGVLYTANDTITMVYAGDPTCENGAGKIPFEVEETLHIVAGTGIYVGVEPGSFIVLKGVINNCPSLAEFGQNNFDVVGGSVTITQ
ncbi:hypothetical protein [Colwellia sp. C1TZA3]|uniref:hypothetical protein n=1 Tax=Colwellia sp. C1TZA3 TaxID=2508879 RepID=UPI0011B97381|nr:hypothetical protein [Colwellia sp. C1TZA3]TWX63395.1 hypothetical protein ESZ39_16950 [Colwellia sp. C1TZA3]